MGHDKEKPHFQPIFKDKCVFSSQCAYFAVTLRVETEGGDAGEVSDRSDESDRSDNSDRSDRSDKSDTILL